MQWLVEDPRSERAAVAAVAALGEKATIHRGPVSTAPAARIRFVFASDLAGYLAAVTGRAREQTILVNAERFEVLELLEAHELGGAIECEERDAWTGDDARMFVRKETLDLSRGTAIGGAGRESERFVLWTRPDEMTRTCRLADLVREVARALRVFATRFDELVISADDARRHQLPAIGMRMIVGRTGLMPQLFSRPGWYVDFQSPPGGLAAFGIHVCADAAPDAIVRASLGGDASFAGTEEVNLAGATRTAALCVTDGDDELMRIGWCLVPLGDLVVRLGSRLAMGEPPSWAAITRQPGLAILAGSLALIPT